MTGDIVARLRDGKNWLNGGKCCGDVERITGVCAAPACVFGEAVGAFHEAADEITRLRTDLAAARSEISAYAKENLEFYDRYTKAEGDVEDAYNAACDDALEYKVELDAVRADLAAARESHQNHILDAMREWKESDEEYEAKLAAANELLQEARKLIARCDPQDFFNMLARIDAALKGDGE